MGANLRLTKLLCLVFALLLGPPAAASASPLVTASAISLGLVQLQNQEGSLGHSAFLATFSAGETSELRVRVCAADFQCRDARVPLSESNYSIRKGDGFLDATITTTVPSIGYVDLRIASLDYAWRLGTCARAEAKVAAQVVAEEVWHTVTQGSLGDWTVTGNACGLNAQVGSVFWVSA